MLSVVVATYKRAEILLRTLRSLSHCKRPAGLDWEVLLVDNSIDREATPIVHQFQDQLPIRHVHEPVPGVSNARNRGVAASKGDLIWFLDDDVRLAPAWLGATHAASREFLKASFFQGRLTPEWESGTAPSWVDFKAAGPKNHSGTYVLYDMGDAPIDLGQDAPLITANLGVRRAVFDKIGGFRPDLCPIGHRHRLGGDTEFGERANAAGLRGTYVAGAEAFHFTPAARERASFALRWSYHHGWSNQHIKAIRFARKGQFGVAFRLSELTKNCFRMCLGLTPAMFLSLFTSKRRCVALWMQGFYCLGRLSACFAPRPDLSLDWPEGFRALRDH